MGELLTPEQAGTYWDERHRTLGEGRSGGDIGLSETANEIFYAVRLGLLLRLLGDYTTPSAPLRLLDAGCGKGTFARALARCGYSVTGVDASPAAIEHARRLGGAHYVLSSLAAYRCGLLFHAVVCVDVLFHVVDDDEWRASLRNLAGLVVLGGRLVVSDAVYDRRVPLGDYIAHRPLSDYLAVLVPAGLRHDDSAPYAFRDNPNAFHAFTRVR
jgi:2-polyprenyl-3-methyl-5-hydroxy-6-metoxy-1,4-benzoquinol methylase